MPNFREPPFHLRLTYGPDDDRLQGFFVPVLARSVRYDRATGYFTSSALVSVARGLVPFIHNGGRMRLLAGAQLTAADAAALDHGVALENVLVDRLLTDPLAAETLIAQRRLEVLAWLVREGRLEVRIAVRFDAQNRPLPPEASAAYYHKKTGIFHDAAGNRIAMNGSNNESAMAWDETGNAEAFDVFCSWDDAIWPKYGADKEAAFEREWSGLAPRWRVLPLPDAVRERLVRLVTFHGDFPFDGEHDLTRELPPRASHAPTPAAQRITPASSTRPERDPLALERLRLLRDAPRADGGTGVGIVTAPVEAWPHQRRIAHRITSTFPRSYLLADEVGLGKTIEAGLVLRELLLSGRATRILILVPASVIKQWQEELTEKFLLRIPRYDGGAFLTRSGGEDRLVTPPADATNPWNAFPVLLASSHLARTRQRRAQVLAAGAWDAVFVDEAHHARRRGGKSDASPNALLALLQTMKAAGAWRALYLASATPMQMHAHEAWDLLELLGLTPGWGASADAFTRYYEQLRAEGERDWTLLQTLLADHLTDPANAPPTALEARIRARAPSPLRARRILEFHQGAVTPRTAAALPEEERAALDLWLRENTPMRRRVFRTTRSTLHEYRAIGLLDPGTVIPERDVADRFIRMNDAEADLYARIEGYIGRYYDRYKRAEGKQRALGFIMTIYRRRLTSSFQAITRSLQKRRETLTRDDATLDALLDDDDRAALDTTLFEPDELGGIKLQLTRELDELDAFLRDLHRLPPDESKMIHLLTDLHDAFHRGHRTAIVFTQYGDTLEYVAEKLTGTFGNAVATWSGDGGRRWNAAQRTWEKVPKPTLKDLFRAGEEVRILVGTDSMSEGLNLQTCALLVNYDMPWNFMRVEQRIGRIDRIGGQPTVTVLNYFYADTVEQRIYTGLREDVAWFQHVVGRARPVLGSLETAIEDAAMHERARDRDTAIDAAIDRVRDDLRALERQSVQIDDATSSVDDHDEPAPSVTLATLERELTTNPLTQALFTPHPTTPGVYHLTLPGQPPALVTFDRALSERSGVTLLTYGAEEFEAVMRDA